MFSFYPCNFLDFLLIPCFCLFLTHAMFSFCLLLSNHRILKQYLPGTHDTVRCHHSDVLSHFQYVSHACLTRKAIREKK